MRSRLIFSSRLYLGEGIERKKLGKIKHDLLYKPLCARVYILTFAHNPNDQLEFFDGRQIAQVHYRTHPLKVLGIARDYGDALQLVAKITEECLKDRGDCRLKEYLL